MNAAVLALKWYKMSTFVQTYGGSGCWKNIADALAVENSSSVKQCSTSGDRATSGGK